MWPLNKTLNDDENETYHASCNCIMELIRM